jgi:membrane protein implicated in regulation of membrane protease activity
MYNGTLGVMSSFQELAMSKSSKKTNVAAFIAILVLSATTMLVLFWRFPLLTGMVTLAVLAAFWISARLARSLEVEMSDLDSGEHTV